MGRFVNRFACGLILALASGAWASTVTFDVVSGDDPSAASVTVAPGSKFSYTITVRVTRGSPTETTSFGGGSVDLITNLGVMQEPATDFFEAGVFADFWDPDADPPVLLCRPLLPTTGTPQNDDLIGIGWSQCVLGGGLDGLFLNTTGVFAVGELTAPLTEGTYQVELAAGSANVMRLDLEGTYPADEVILGPGLEVVVSAGDGGGSPGGGGGTGGTEPEPDPEPQPTPDPDPTPEPDPEPQPDPTPEPPPDTTTDDANGTDDSMGTGDPGNTDDPTTGGDGDGDENAPPAAAPAPFCGAGIGASATAMLVGLWLMGPICSAGRRRR